MQDQERVTVIRSNTLGSAAFAALLLLGMLLFLALPYSAHAAPAATCTWTGAVDTDWHTTGNWDCGQAPTGGDDVIIANGANNAVISAAAEANALTIDLGAQLSLSSDSSLTVMGDWLNNGTFNPGTGTVVFGSGGTQAIQAAGGSAFLVGPEDFGLDGSAAFPPDGWSMVPASGSSCVWANTATTDPQSNLNHTGGTGNAATADGLFYCRAAMDAELVTPAFDLFSAGAPTLRFNTDYFPRHIDDTVNVDISVDSTTWSSLWTRTGFDFYNGSVTLDLSGYVGQPTVWVRFHYVSTSSEGGEWQIDDVTVSDATDLSGAQQFYNITVDANTTVALGGPLTLGELGDLTPEVPCWTCRRQTAI